MSFGPNTPIQPTLVPFRNPSSELIDDRGEFTDNEVYWMNRDHGGYFGIGNQVECQNGQYHICKLCRE